jgi:hypothetical protein
MKNVKTKNDYAEEKTDKKDVYKTPERETTKRHSRGDAIRFVKRTILSLHIATQPFAQLAV